MVRLSGRMTSVAAALITLSSSDVVGSPPLSWPAAPVPTTTTPAVSPAQAEPAVFNGFFGEGYPADAAPAPFGLVTSLGYGTWIHPRPDTRTLPLGGVHPGHSLALIGEERVRGTGWCPEFVRVAGGYVCATRRATTDARSAWVRAMRWTTPAPGPWPYEYALSVGAPMLTRIPKPGEAIPDTGDRTTPLRGWLAGHDELAEQAPIEANGPIPDFLRDGASVPTTWGAPSALVAKRVPRGSTVAYTRAFEANGEVWVLTSDLRVVPARGLKRYRHDGFAGLPLGGDVTLPVAWVRRTARPKYRRATDGFVPTGETWPAKSWVALGAERVRAGKRTYVATREPGMYVDARDVSVVAAARRVPYEIARDAKWIDVRARAGTLTLYEGLRPVFTTLIATGKKGGTPRGRFFVESLHAFSTMSTEKGEPRKYWVSEVPWTLYLERPYALHASYWHQSWGEEVSNGCVNLSPIDAKRVFDWAIPELPDGWGEVESRVSRRVFVLISD